jgi:hypothetical protein
MGWPESLDKHLVEGCLKVVQDGIYVTEYTGLFYVEVAKYIWAQTSMSISRTDLKARFEYFKGLWGRYHKLTRELARSPAGTSNEHVPHLNISLSFSVYRTEPLTDAFHCR